MEIQYVYVKPRSQFGKQCFFEDYGPNLEENLPPDPELMVDYIRKDPCHVAVQVSKQLALHEMQTESRVTKETAMCHTEGGWPKEINFKDDEVTARYRRRIEKDDNWGPKMNSLIQPIEHCILQNNAVNIHENYFDDMIPTELVLPLEIRTVNVYADPQVNVRPITHLSWSPDHGKRLAVSYCYTEFQKQNETQFSPYSYIWDIENPNTAFMALKVFCPSLTIEFNPRDPSLLIGGLMSGQVCYWDIRSGNTPVQISNLQYSHRDPTNCAFWINSKTNSEFFTASTCGMFKWWDIRQLREPTETLIMDLEDPMRGDIVKAIGVSSLQFEPTMGTKFMAGMENGVVVSGNRKGKNALEKLALRFQCHYGPVVAIDRNPFSPKNFLTIGDWSARIWAEDTKEGNLISTVFMLGCHEITISDPVGNKMQLRLLNEIEISCRMQNTVLTGGCWSKSRYSVFYTINMDGLLEVYDILVHVASPVCSIRLCEDGLSAITPHEEGKLVVVGNLKGNVYLVESSEALTTNSKNDKLLMTAYLDRCSRYEKAVDSRLREVRLTQRIVYEQTPEPTLAIAKDREKGKGKNKGKDRAKSGNKDKSKDDKEKKRIKGRKRDILLDEPELLDAETQFFEFINKEMGKYRDTEDSDEILTFAMTSEMSTRPKKYGETRSDKDVVKKSIETKQKRDKKGSKRSSKTQPTEEIVIVKKKQEDEKSKKEKDFLSHETEENVPRRSQDNAEIDDSKLPLKSAEDIDDIDLEGVKRKTPVRHLKKSGFFKTHRGIGDHFCEEPCRPEICCLERGALKRKKTMDPESSGEEAAEARLTSQLLENFARTLPEKEILGSTMGREILEERNKLPEVLAKEVEIARREIGETINVISPGKQLPGMKLSVPEKEVKQREKICRPLKKQKLISEKEEFNFPFNLENISEGKDLERLEESEEKEYPRISAANIGKN